MSFDLAIVLIFLVLNLAVGIYKGRGVKNINDFALGGRNFSLFALVATLVATWSSGSAFAITLSRVYSEGISDVIASSCMIIPFLIVAYFFIPRMKQFLGDLSVADTMGKLYGDKVRVVTAITGSIGAAGLISVQFKVIANIVFFYIVPKIGCNISQTDSIILVASIVIFYSAFGGVRSVTFTDVLQFLTFALIIPILGFIIWKSFSSLGYSIKAAFAHPKFDIKEALNYNNPGFWGLIALMGYFAIPGIVPAMYQRIIMGKNVFQIQKAWILAGTVVLFIVLTLSFVPFLIFHINPDLDKSKLLSYIIDNYSFPGFTGVILIAIIALGFSTADSHINSSAVLLSNDIFFGKKDKLKLARIFSILLGITATCLACYGGDLLSIILLANSFYMPVVTIPLIITILGFRTKTKAILTGMAAGVVTIIIWKYILKINADPIVFAMGVNFIFIMASHYLLKLEGGWNAVETPDEVIMIKEKRARDFKKVKEYIKGFSYIKFCEKYSLKNAMNYITFGIVSFFVIMVTLFSMPVKMQILQFEGLKILLVVALTTSAIFSGFYLWPIKIRKLEYIDRIFPFGALILLPLTGSLFVIASGFYTTQLMIFILDMVILSLLIRWKPALLISISGIYLAKKIAPYIFQIDATQNYNQIDSIYVVLLFSVFIIRFFIGPKEEKETVTEFVIKDLKERHEDDRLEMMKLENVRNDFVNRIKDEALIIFDDSYKKFQKLKKNLLEEYDTKEKMDDFLQKLSPIIEKFSDGVDYFNSVLKKVRGDIEVNLADYNISKVILEAIDEYKDHSDKNTINFINKINYEKITIDKDYLKKAIKESFEFISRVTDKSCINVILEKDIIKYNLNFTDIKMEKEALKIAFKFKKNKKLENDAQENDVFLSTNIINIMNAHYGKIMKEETKESSETTYSFLIPTNIRKIRPKFMNIRDPIAKKLEYDAKAFINKQETTYKYKLAKKMQEKNIDNATIAELLSLDIKNI